mgnify:CR=1 FL=1
MFRTGLHTVPLQDEIKNASGYLEMQRLMYRDCFYVYMDIPEETQQYPVPQMILHTFLENIFKHVISIGFVHYGSDSGIVELFGEGSLLKTGTIYIAGSIFAGNTGLCE